MAEGELVSLAATAADDQPGGEIEVGQWYWIRDDEEDTEPALVCVTKLGSNFAELTSPGGNDWRVHFNEFYARCTPELHPRTVIDERIQNCRQRISETMQKVAELTMRLGVGPRRALAHHGNQTTALAVCSGVDNTQKYKTDLVRAKKEELPALFEKIKDANSELAQWMVAEALPLRAKAGGMQDCVEQISDRIFHVELYAGLVETVVQVKKGKPAGISDKLHLMQRRVYMDEECVAGYRVGGITCETIEQFDRWLSRRENLDRILPYPRCAAAFRVRRMAAKRDWEGSLSKLFVNIALEDADKRTFLYIRNGQQLFRLDTAIEFGPKLFPDQKEFDLTQPLWGRRFASSSIEEFITDGDYQERRKKEAERIELSKKWKREHPRSDSFFHNPYRHEAYPRLDDFEPFNPSCVYYDEMMIEINNRVKDYNRISVILQGLFDRSQVLHPHPPFRLWTPEGFSQAVELVYDNMTLTSGEPPDFELYRRTCNAGLAAGCVTVGQEAYWEQVEARRECQRRDSNWRYSGQDYRPTRVRPYGDPGPGHLAVVAEWRSRSRRAKYVWERARRTYRRWDNGPISASLLVPDKLLLNCDGYQSGDFRQFYADCRTRSQYLQWAPLLLAAEEYRAGNLKPGNKKEFDA